MIGAFESFVFGVCTVVGTHNNNNNNIRPFLYSAFHARGVSQSASNIITPGHWALNHSLNHLSSLGSMQPVPNMRYSAKPITRTISALTSTHLPLGG